MKATYQLYQAVSFAFSHPSAHHLLRPLIGRGDVLPEKVG